MYRNFHLLTDIEVNVNLYEIFVIRIKQESLSTNAGFNFSQKKDIISLEKIYC